MKVLWFSNTPCGSIRRDSDSMKSSNGGGWLISLEDELKKKTDINLSVSYISSKLEASFLYDGVHYFPVCREVTTNKILKVLSRLTPYDKQDKQILPKLLNIVNIVKPDIIHIHGTEGSFGLIQEYITDIPIVFSIQGLIAPYTEKFFSGMTYAQVKKYEPIIDKIKFVSIVNTYKSFCYRAPRERRFLDKARYVFGRTFWDEYCTLALNPQRKYFVVNEVLRDTFYKKRWKKKAFGNKIKLVSTISGGVYKGFEMVLKTCHLLSQHTKFDYEWHIAGYTQSMKWVNIAENITGIKVSEYPILFHGRIDAEDLSDLLVSSDIYVHVSHIENSPNSVCEAMLLGMPVIASYAGGTASLLQSGVEGVLVQDGDPYVLAGTIVELYQHQDRAIEYGKAAYEKANYRHNKSKIIGELLGGYHAILSDYNSLK